ncbi:MAG: hypothetical protein QM785_08680 [Pyrinomonadaceae bacterium]
MARPIDGNDYTLVVARSPQELIDMVRRARRDGWQLAGGMSITALVGDPDGDGKDASVIYYAQSLTG